MPRFSSNIWCAIGVSAGTLIYLAEARKLPFGGARNPDIGFLPILTGFFVLGLALLLVVAEFARSAAPPNRLDRDAAEENGESAGLKKPVLLGAALLVYPAFFLYLGFLLSTVLLMAVSLRLMEYRGWAGSLILSALITGCAYLLFGYWLHVNFPKGILG